MTDYTEYDQEYDDIAANMSNYEYEEVVASYLRPNHVEWVFVCILTGMMVVGAMGNALVVLVVVSRKNMWSSMNIFLSNLACADLLILLICLPPTVLNDVTKTFWLSTAFCKGMLFIQNTSVYVSILSLVGVAFERWRAITCPLKAQVKPTRYIIAGTWLVALLMSSPEPVTLQLQPAAFARHNFSTTWGTQCKETWSRAVQKRYQLAQVLGAYVFPLVLISYMCLQMSRTLNYCQLAVGARQMRNRKKAVRMLVAVVCLFALSNLPVHLYNLASSFDLLTPANGEDFDMNLIAVRKLLPRVFSYSGSCLNPILYNFMCGKFRAAFARVVCCGHQSRQQSSTKTPTSAPGGAGASSARALRFLSFLRRESTGI